MFQCDSHYCHDLGEEITRGAVPYKQLMNRVQATAEQWVWSTKQLMHKSWLPWWLHFLAWISCEHRSVLPRRRFVVCARWQI